MFQLGAFFLPAVPLLVLLGALLLGRYPGHEAIVRLSERLATRPHRRRAAAPPSHPPHLPSLAPAGGLHLAYGLAQRPPPPSA